MPPSSRAVRGGMLRGAVLWVGIVGVSFCGVAGALFLVEPDEAPAARLTGPEPEPTARALDVGPGTEATVLPDDPEAEDVEIPPAEAVVADASEDDVFDNEVAAGDLPADLIPTKPQPPIPRGVVDLPREPEWILHTSAAGETVDQLAYRYGIRPPSVRMWNGLKSTATRLRTGSKLKIRAKRIPPQRVELEYVVKPGDTWWKIGIRYGVDSKELRRANLDAQQQLVVGQSIRVWVDPVVFEWVASEDDPGNGDKVRPGAVGVGPPQNGTLINGVLLGPSPYYTLRLPPTSYGTTHAIESLRRGLVRFESRSAYPRPLVLGSMSAKHGGPLVGHRSHQTGRDLDIRLPLQTKYPDWFPVEPKRVDWVATWQLITALAETEQVIAVFLDYDLQKLLHRAATESGATEEERAAFIQWPRGDKAHRGLVRDSPGHEGHIHIRFACGIYEIECVSPGDAE